MQNRRTKKIIATFLATWYFLINNVPPLALAQESVATESATNVELITPVVSEIGPLDLSESPSSLSSASVKLETKIHDLDKKDFRADEEIAIVVENASDSETTVSIFDVDGNSVQMEVVKQDQTQDQTYIVKPPQDLKPGRYRVKIESSLGEVSTQDFTWGVLAINTNKSIYRVGDSAFIAMAVLDETGEMVCNAQVELTITNPSGEKTILKTTDGTIIVNPQCYSKDLTVLPDYQTSYQTTSTGTYNIELSATTDDGTYVITDSFTVAENSLFDVDRLTATRIYPPLTYPVTMKIVASEDFVGTIEEKVPASFEITPLVDTRPFDQVEMQATTDTQVVYDQSLYDIGKPFKEDYPSTLGFGRQHRDPKLSQKYTAFGVTGHDGIDFALPEGSQVLAVADGKVVRSGDGDYGVTIVIEHAWGKSYYGHLSKVLKSEGEEVKKGQLIALSGSTGLSSGPHLHFGIKPNQHDFDNGYFGKVNPLAFLQVEDAEISQGVVAGVSTSTVDQVTAGTKIIKWNVDIKKGEEITIGYQFNAPDVSPELFRIGPLSFVRDDATLFSEQRQWLIASDSVVVSGGITSAEAQFGGLQRKVAYVNSNWYAFYTDDADVWYKKSADGVTWGSPVDMDTGDADNYNPSIDVSGNFILVVWIDDSSERFEVTTIDTGSSDALIGICAGLNEGTIGSTFLPNIAALSTTSAVISLTDSSSDTEINLYEAINLTGSPTCTPTITDVHLGNITFGSQGSGVTASDMPVLVPISSTRAMMVYQDGSNLRSAMYDTTTDEWSENHQLIANVSDTIYSVATDGTTIWVLSQNGTTATRLYKRNGADIVETQIDSDAGSTADDGDSDIDMFCVTADDCKIVYTDDIDTAQPTLIFRDCDDADCSTGASTTLDSDIGAANDQAGPSIYCLSSTNCKVAYGDDMNTTTPALEMIDCANDECTSPTVSNEIVGDLGSSAAILHTSIYCLTDTNCKIVYGGSDLLVVGFVDCPDATCTGTSTTGTCTSGDRVCTTLDSNAGALANVDLYCVASDNCKVVYHDNNATGGCADANSICFVDCTADEDCSTNTQTIIDAAAGTTSGAVYVAVDCVGGDTECSILYGDGADNDLTFVDCEGSATCATGATLTDIDINGGANTQLAHRLDLYCPSNDNCKFIYVGDMTSTAEDAYFGDCANETCTAGSVYDLPGPRFGGAIYCPTSSDCKMAYYEGTSASAPTVVFADCDTEDCLPPWSSLTAPWTSETNVISLSLTYDSTNTDLIASIIKDTSELAYYKSSDAASISWGSQTAYDFTAGDLDNLSTPRTVAGTTNMGALLRQGSNLEFDLLAGSAASPTLDQLMRHGAWFNAGAEQAFTF